MLISPPIILQSLRQFLRRMEDVWDERNWRPPAGQYLLDDAVVDLQYTEGRNYPKAHVSVVEYLPTYP